MKNNNLEIILFSKLPITDLHQNEVVNWITTTVQPAIGRQDESAKKIFLKCLKDSPAIYLS